MAFYGDALEHTHLLFPHTGIRCIERQRRLSQQGLLLLSADKGSHLLSELDNRPAPKLATHGSFSLSVNYHAFREYCQKQGGLAFFHGTIMLALIWVVCCSLKMRRHFGKPFMPTNALLTTMGRMITSA
jgi:hypothetical protein